jgi:hypothetical protein
LRIRSVVGSAATAGDLSPQLHFDCVVNDGVFDSAEGAIVFHAVSGLDANAIARAYQSVRQPVRQRLLRGFERRGLLPAADAQAIPHWEHGDGFSIEASVRIAAAGRDGPSSSAVGHMEATRR